MVRARPSAARGGSAPAHATALAQHRAGRLDEAEASYRQVLAGAPANATAWHMLGVLMCQRGRFEAGIDAFERAVAADPGLAAAWLDLGAAHRERRNLDAALAAYGRAIGLHPANGELHNRRGEILSLARRDEEALAAYERALALDPGKPAHAANVGAALLALGRPGPAIAYLRDTLVRAPNHHIALANLGVAQQALGQRADARASYGRALDLAPAYVEARWNLSLLDLLEGRFEAGWRGHEVRWQRPANEAPRHAELPRWRAELGLAGRRMLLWAEQGLGDTLQFGRYAPWLAARGARVVLEVQAPLCALLRTLGGVEQVVAVGQAHAPCDVQLPLMSLPGEFAAGEHVHVAPPPYLRPDPEKVHRWAQRLRRRSGRPLYGLVCSGNPAHRKDAERSIALRRFDRLLPRGDWVLLQRELRERDEECLKRSAILDLRRDLDDFADTAAIVQNLDLVITVDTAVAHLAGALGKPVWILLPYAPDWRWLLDRSDSPWYPSARLFRQRAPDDWDPVLDDVARALDARAPDGTGAAPPQGQQTVT